MSNIVLLKLCIYVIFSLSPVARVPSALDFPSNMYALSPEIFWPNLEAYKYNNLAGVSYLLSKSGVIVLSGPSNLLILGSSAKLFNAAVICCLFNLTSPTNSPFLGCDIFPNFLSCSTIALSSASSHPGTASSATIGVLAEDVSVRSVLCISSISASISFLRFLLPFPDNASLSAFNLLITPICSSMAPRSVVGATGPFAVEYPLILSSILVMTICREPIWSCAILYRFSASMCRKCLKSNTISA